MAESPLAQHERLHRKSTAKPPWHFRPRDEYVTSLRRGSSLLKFGRTGTPDFKFFRISVDESELQWKSDLVGHGTRAVQLSMVREIVEGQTTQTFKRDLRPSLAHLSFSLIYDKRGRERSLDLVCKTEQEYELWLHGLQAFVAFQREKQRRLSQSGVAAQSLARKSVSKFLGSSSHDADDGEEAQQEDSNSSENLLCDMYVWGGREADLTTPVEGWQQTLSPVLVNDSARLDVSQVCIGSGHAVLVTKHGQVYSWGRGLGGQLGHGGSQDFAQPKLVRELWERSIIVRQVECSDTMSMAVTSCGEVYTWGDGKKSGVLGLGKMVDRHWTPHKVDFPMQSIRIVSVSAGPFHCAAVSSHGGLYTWGDGFGGRLGHGTAQNRFVPTFVDYFNDMRVESVACGVFHTAAVVSPKGESSTPAEMSSYTCAQDLLDRPAMAAAAFAAKDLPEVPKNLNWGPLKTPTRASFMCPAAPQTLTPSNSQNVFSLFPPEGASDLNVSGVSFTGEGARVVFTWGANDRGCLGRGEEGQDELLPGRVEGELSGLDVKQVSCGYHLTAAVSSCGRAYQWGSTGTSVSEAAPWTRSDKPRQVRGDIDSWNVEEVRCGNHHCIARATAPIGADPSTVLFAWGRGVEGQLGNEEGKDSGMPQKIRQLKGQETVGIVAGANHCMAVCHNNPAVTEAAAMKDAERLKPFLLGKDERTRRSSLTIQVPTGYTTGGPLSASSNASNAAANLPDRSPLPTGRRNSTALVLQQTSTNAQRRSVGRSSGTFSTLFRAAQATHMARKAAANAARSRQNNSEVAYLYRGGTNFHHAWPPEDRAQSSEQGDTDESFDDSQEASPTEPPPTCTTPVLNQKYVESLEQQVAKMSSKIESLEEQLHRRVRHEHEPMRNSFTSLTRVRTSPESLARRTRHNSESSAGGLSSPGVELPIPAASTTTRSQTSQPLIPPTPNTVGTTPNGLKPWSSPLIDGNETLQNGVKEQGDVRPAAEEISAATMSRRIGFNENGVGETVGDDEADSGAIQGACEMEGSAETSGQEEPLRGQQGRSRAASMDGESKHDKMMRKLVEENTALKDQVKELQARLGAHVRGAAVEVLPSSRLTQQFRQRRNTGGSTGSPTKPVEWIETVHPGVHLTLGAGPGGQTEVRKVRFSSKAFSKIEAQTWWRENRQSLSERYCVAAAAGAPYAGMMDAAHSLDSGARSPQQLSVDAMMSQTVLDDADHHIHASSMSASAAAPVSPSVESLVHTPPGAAPPNMAGSPSTMAKPAVVMVD